MAAPRSRLLDRLRRRLPADVREALRHAVALAEARGVDLYLVGGGVRDLLLGAAHLDLDLVTEGDAVALAKALGRDLGARAVAHPRFGTAVVRGEGFRLDLARARAERYARPGALPAVRPATLVDDLARRDFTVNAMALRLTGPRPGELLDPHGGGEDLARRVVRVLHDASFQDDATRILRACRYAGRLGFRLERHTRSLLQRDLCYFDTISGARMRAELERIAAEERAAQIVRLAGRLGVLAAVHTALHLDDLASRALARLRRVAASHRAAVLCCLLLAEATLAIAEGAIARLSLTRAEAEAVRGFLALRAHEASLARRSLRPSAAVGLIEPHSLAAIEAFALLAGRSLAGERARRYLTQWRFVRPRLNGRDVEALGVPRGPRIGEALARLRAARLDGAARSRDDEVALVRRMARSSPLGARRG